MAHLTKSSLEDILALRPKTLFLPQEEPFLKRIISAMMSVLFVFCAFSSLSGCTGENEGGDDTTAGSGKTPAEEKGNVLYVSADAEEGGDGSAEKPFSTITAARDGIRSIKQGEGLPDGGITVLISGGIYRIAEPIELLAEDSGEEGKQITYKALDGAEVVIDGGVQLKGELFEDFFLMKQSPSSFRLISAQLAAMILIMLNPTAGAAISFTRISRSSTLTEKGSASHSGLTMTSLMHPAWSLNVTPMTIPTDIR